MPAIVFPPEPQDGDDFIANGRTWTYDASIPAWRPKATIAVPPELSSTFVAHNMVQVLGDTAKRLAQSNIGLPKMNLIATAAPGVSDDSAAGYSVLSLWGDVTNDHAYVCLDSTVGAAVWRLLTVTAEQVAELIDVSAAFADITTVGETDGQFIRIQEGGGLESVDVAAARAVLMPVLISDATPNGTTSTLTGAAAVDALVLSGAGTNTVNGLWLASGTLNGKPQYRKAVVTADTDYTDSDLITVSDWPRLSWAGGIWMVFGSDVQPIYSSVSEAATPDLVVTWTVGIAGSVEAPEVTAYVDGDPFFVDQPVIPDFIGQLCRAGTAAPFAWFAADTIAPVLWRALASDAVLTTAQTLSLDQKTQVHANISTALEFAGADPNIPETITLTGEFSYDGITNVTSPVVLALNGTGLAGRPKWSGANEDLNPTVGGWELSTGSGVVFDAASDNLLSPVAVWVSSGSGTGSFEVTTDAPAATHVGQWCKTPTGIADTFDWWQWNGVEWVFVRTDWVAGGLDESSVVRYDVVQTPLIAGELSQFLDNLGRDEDSILLFADTNFQLNSILVDNIYSTSQAAAMGIMPDGVVIFSGGLAGVNIWDDVGILSIDLYSRQLFVGPNKIVDWNTCELFDPSSAIALDWNYRYLHDYLGNIVLDWSRTSGAGGPLHFYADLDLGSYNLSGVNTIDASVIKSARYEIYDGFSMVSGYSTTETFTTVDGKTVTVVGGIITNITT